MLWDPQEAAEKVGLSPITLRNYAKGRSTLIRGYDFVVRTYHRGRWVWRRLFFTDRGVLRLQAKAYAVFYNGCSRSSEEQRHAFLKGQNERSIRPIESYSRTERRMRLKERLAAMARDYLDHPCAVPNCPCVVHKLGAPQADVVQRVMKTDGYVDFAGAFHRFER